MKKIAGVLAIAVLLTPGPTHAQGAGIALHAGTLGLGVDIAAGLGSRVGLRSGFNYFPTEFNLTVSDVAYSIDASSPTFTAMLDLYLAGPFRITGGGIYTTDDVVLTGRATTSIDVNGTPYIPSQVGTLTGTILTNELSPYAGIGVGNPARSKFGFFLDLGVAFHGTPLFTLTADGPASALPQFQADLQAERQAIQEDVEKIIVYPVATLGFSIGF